MSLLKAIGFTIAVVFAALGIAVIVLAVAWVIGNYSVDRLLGIIALVFTIVGFLFAIVVHFRPRR